MLRVSDDKWDTKKVIRCTEVDSDATNLIVKQSHKQTDPTRYYNK